jgi:DNA-binding transcriptional LysR family regulator
MAMPPDARIRRRLRLRDLDTLITVAQYGSMAKAAAQLSVSQPAVSKAMAEMEHTLGVRLLDRTAQGVEPNLYGRALLKWAQAVFDDVRQGVKEIEFLADPTAGELRVGAAEPIIAGLLPAILERLHRQYPRIAILVKYILVAAWQYRDLRERNIDLVLGRVAKPIDEDVDADILYHERNFVVAGVDNPLARRRKIRLAELVDEPWTLPPPETVIGGLIAEAFRACGLEVPRANVIAASIQLHGALIASGPYLAIYPGSVLRFSPQRHALKALPVDLPIPPWPVSIITLKNRTISPVAQIFIECAREVAKPLAKLKS